MLGQLKNTRLLTGENKGPRKALRKATPLKNTLAGTLHELKTGTGEHVCPKTTEEHHVVFFSGTPPPGGWGVGGARGGNPR